jgi:uncharacterized protein
MKVIAMVLLALAAVAPAHAQTKKELAAKLIELQKPAIEGLGSRLAGQEAQRFLQAAGAQMGRVPADRREAVGQEIQADVKKFHDEVEPLLRERALKLAPTLATMFEERFSEEELKQIVAWIESPASRKFAQFSAEFGNSLAEKLVADARPAVDPKIKALEASVAKRLGLAPAAAASAPPKKK